MKLLVDGGLIGMPDTSPQWPVTVGVMPSGTNVSDKYVQIRGVTAPTDGRNHRTGVAVEHPRMQFMVRALSQEEAELKANTIVEYLMQVAQRTVIYNTVTVLVHAYALVMPVGYVEQDEQNRRQTYSFTVQITMEEV